MPFDASFSLRSPKVAQILQFIANFDKELRRQFDLETYSLTLEWVVDDTRTPFQHIGKSANVSLFVTRQISRERITSLALGLEISGTSTIFLTGIGHAGDQMTDYIVRHFSRDLPHILKPQPVTT